jgi:elongation factor G
MGSAFKNKGVQPLLDAVQDTFLLHFLKQKSQLIKETGGKEEKSLLSQYFDKPLVCMAFKITDEQFGQLTYTRIYQGTLNKGDTVFNTRTKKKVRVGRMVRMNSNDRENIDVAGAGDIIAMVGVDCASGDTFVGDEICSTSLVRECTFQFQLSSFQLKLKIKNAQAKMSKGLQRFRKEDPTFHVFTDEESGETRIAGMGELHLEIYVERLKREYKADVEVGAPQVNYRETIRTPAEFDYTHKKQTGGSGQFGQVVGKIRPLTEDNKDREDQNFKFQ